MHELARYNGKTSNLTLEQLLVVGGKKRLWMLASGNRFREGGITVCFGWGCNRIAGIVVSLFMLFSPTFPFRVLIFH